MKANELRIGNYVYHNHSIGMKLNCELTCGKDINLHKEFEPIPLTEEWLLKFGFENWGKGKQWSTEFETYDRFVLHNALDGTSNFEVHNVVSTYGDTYFQQYIISCDEDDRLNWGSDIKYVHQLQNLYFALTNNELTL